MVMAVQNDVYSQRWGTFRIPVRWIERQAELVRQILSECVVVEARMRMDLGAVEYVALCPSFYQCPDGAAAVEYTIEIRERDNDENVPAGSAWTFDGFKAVY